MIDGLDLGELRLAEKLNGDWLVNAWVQQAILLYFRLRQLETWQVGQFEYHDKIPLKHDYARLGVRVVPPAVARYGSFLERGIVISLGTFFGPSGDGYVRFALVPTEEECRAAAEILEDVL